jgi:hypothetical protein
MTVPTPIQSSTYNVKDHTITFLVAGAPIPLLGVGDDSEKFTYARDEDAWTKKHDCDGNVAWSYNPSRGGEIVIKTLHTNKTATTILQTLLGVPNPITEVINPVVFDVSITDNNGTWLLQGNKCRIAKQPDGNRGKEIGTLEWRIMCGELLVNEQGVNLDA